MTKKNNIFTASFILVFITLFNNNVNGQSWQLSIS